MVELYKLLSTLVKYKTKSTTEYSSQYELQIIGALFTYFATLGIQLPEQEKNHIMYMLIDQFIDFKRLIQKKEELE